MKLRSFIIIFLLISALFAQGVNSQTYFGLLGGVDYASIKEGKEPFYIGSTQEGLIRNLFGGLSVEHQLSNKLSLSLTSMYGQKEFGVEYTFFTIAGIELVQMNYWRNSITVKWNPWKGLILGSGPGFNYLHKLNN